MATVEHHAFAIDVQSIITLGSISVALALLLLFFIWLSRTGDSN